MHFSKVHQKCIKRCTFQKCIKSAKVHQKCIKNASKVHQKCIKFSSNLHEFCSKSVPTLHHKYKDVCVNHVTKLYQKFYANSIAQVHQNLFLHHFTGMYSQCTLKIYAHKYIKVKWLSHSPDLYLCTLELAYICT